MKMLALKDNPLFLKNWYERTRLITVVSYLFIVVLIILLIGIGCYLARDQFSSKTDPALNSVFWLQGVFIGLIILQAIVLFLVGAVIANKMAAQERVGGTIDLHRASPTSRIDQVIGMVLGGAALEWCIFLGIIPLVAAISLILRFDIFTLFIFYLLFTVCALLFHAVAVLGGLGFIRRSKRSMGFGMIVFLFIIFGAVLRLLEVSSFYLLSGIGGFRLIFMMIFNGASALARPPVSDFFGISIPSYQLQLAFHLLVLLVVVSGIKHKISHPERSLFSKAQSIILTLFFLATYAGTASSGPGLARYGVWHGTGEPQKLILFFYLVVVLAITGALATTPTRLEYRRGLARKKKAGERRFSLSDDQNSNWYWLIAFCFISFFSYVLLLGRMSRQSYDMFLCIVVVLGQIVFFVSSLEAFRLGPYCHRQVFLWAGIAIVWLILPIFGFLTLSVLHGSQYLQYFISASPFITIPYMSTDVFLGRESSAQISLMMLVYVNVALAVASVLWAYRTRTKIQGEKEKKQRITGAIETRLR